MEKGHVWVGRLRMITSVLSKLFYSSHEFLFDVLACLGAWGAKSKVYVAWPGARLVGASSHAPQGCGVDPQSGHIPRLQVWPLVRHKTRMLKTRPSLDQFPGPHQNGLCSSAQRELFNPSLNLFVLLSLSLLVKTSTCTEMLRWALGHEFPIFSGGRPLNKPLCFSPAPGSWVLAFEAAGSSRFSISDIHGYTHMHVVTNQIASIN